MFLKKVAVFLALAFLALDLMLAVLYFQTRNNMFVLPERMIDDAAAYLAANDIKLSRSVIEKRIPDNAVYTFAAENTAVSSEVAAAIAASYFTSEATASMLETPDGMTFSIQADGVSAAALRVYYGSFRFEYSEADFVRESEVPLSETAFDNGEKVLSAETERAVQRFLKLLVSPSAGSALYTVRGSVASGDGIYVCVSQNVGGAFEINDMFTNLLVRDGRVVYACGNRIFSAVRKSYREQLTDGVNALRSLNLDTVSEILSEEIVYTERSTGNGTHYLIPLWKIVYMDTTSARITQYVDAIKRT